MGSIVLVEGSLENSEGPLNRTRAQSALDHSGLGLQVGFGDVYEKVKPSDGALLRGEVLPLEN